MAFLSVWVAYGSVQSVEFAKPAILLGNYVQTFEPACFMSAMLLMAPSTFYTIFSDLDVGLMIETTEFYILIPVWMTLTFIQCHSCLRKEKFLCPSSWNFSVHLCEIYCDATTCRFLVACAKFALRDSYSRERTLRMWFYQVYQKTLACIRTLVNWFVQTWYDVKHN